MLDTQLKVFNNLISFISDYHPICINLLQKRILYDEHCSSLFHQKNSWCMIQGISTKIQFFEWSKSQFNLSYLLFLSNWQIIIHLSQFNLWYFNLDQINPFLTSELSFISTWFTFNSNVNKIDMWHVTCQFVT